MFPPPLTWQGIADDPRNATLALQGHVAKYNNTRGNTAYQQCSRTITTMQ